MAQSQFQAYPPHRIHSTRLIPQSEALDSVASYLEAATTDASLHPNALLTESGPTSSTQGANLGLILHNLQRFEAGLRGEHLEAELDLVDTGEDALPDAVGVEGVNGVASTTTRLDEEWQDKEDFEREQGIEQGEIEPQISATRENLNGATGALGQANGLSAGDKEARKKRKKQRRQQEKKESAEKAKREKEMDE